MAKSRKVLAGEKMADAIIELAHMMYNHRTAKGYIEAVIKRLKERKGEYVPVKKGG